VQTSAGQHETTHTKGSAVHTVRNILETHTKGSAVHAVRDILERDIVGLAFSEEDDCEHPFCKQQPIGSVSWRKTTRSASGDKPSVANDKFVGKLNLAAPMVASKQLQVDMGAWGSHE